MGIVLVVVLVLGSGFRERTEGGGWMIENGGSRIEDRNGSETDYGLNHGGTEVMKEEMV